MYSPLKSSANSFTEFNLYTTYKTEDDSEIKESFFEDSRLIYPFEWDELRKSIRFMIENDRMPKVRRGLLKLVKRNYILRMHKISKHPLLGIRLYKEIWLVDTNNFVKRGLPNNRKLLIDEDFF